MWGGMPSGWEAHSSDEAYCRSRGRHMAAAAVDPEDGGGRRCGGQRRGKVRGGGRRSGGGQRRGGVRWRRRGRDLAKFRPPPRTTRSYFADPPRTL
jgi:hypothetical protein